MSLINKMLQDLDTRGSHSGAAMPAEIRPVMVAERRLPVAQIALGTTVLVIALGTAGYFWLKGRAPAPLAAAPAVVVAVPAPAAAPVRSPPAVAVKEKSIPFVPPPASVAVAATVAAPVKAVPVKPVAPAPDPLAAPALATAQAPIKDAPALRVAEMERVREAPVPPPRVALAGAPLAGGRDMNNTQRAESFYRQSLVALDDGRVAAAIDGMEQALKLNARHDAARQSLVGLLIEAGRKDEAMQQLEQGLVADPSQAPLAMLLARMQIERGMSGVATLQRTLPAAQNNGEYRAFLAGALQREQRHREAAEQYAAALRSTPEQGVWLMGLGISLQADKRDAEALAAFQRAKVSGMLTPALMTFVQGRVQQLQGQ